MYSVLVELPFSGLGGPVSPGGWTLFFGTLGFGFGVALVSERVSPNACRWAVTI